MKKIFHQFRSALSRFYTKGGSAMLILLCVGVITGTAVWTGQQESIPPSPTPPVQDSHLASMLLQQTLSSAMTPTPLPTRQPELWDPPLPVINVIRGYSETKMVKSESTGLWALHLATDLAGEMGAPVTTMAAGTVSACGERGIYGTWIRIRHGNDYEITYAGLSMLAALREGDTVRIGQTIGFIGNGVIGETDLGPHLHLEVTHNGKPADPCILLKY